MAVTLSNSYGLFTEFVKWGSLTVCAWTTDRTHAFVKVWGARHLHHLRSPPLLARSGLTQRTK